MQEIAPVLAEVFRGNILESQHRGHIVVARPSGELLASLGDPDRIIFPRSSCKMLQALPLLESGAALAANLDARQIALACASHQGAQIHVDHVSDWLDQIGFRESDLLCGAQTSSDKALRKEMIQSGIAPDQRHNNCSGKHTGFLTLSKHLGAGSDYIDVTHPVQQAVRMALEEMADETMAGFGIDGCSAPNFAMRIRGLAISAARMASPTQLGKTRAGAARRIVEAMIAHPELVAGTGRACTELMRAGRGRVAVKTGAEGVFLAILPDLELGVALKIEDGTTRGAEAAIAAVLVALGVLDRDDPLVAKWLVQPMANRRNIIAAQCRASDIIFDTISEI